MRKKEQQQQERRLLRDPHPALGISSSGGTHGIFRAAAQNIIRENIIGEPKISQGNPKHLRGVKSIKGGLKCHSGADSISGEPKKRMQLKKALKVK